MTLKLYNTMSRSLTDLTPVKPGQVSLYACGPTVYDHAHIGHARAVVAFDVLTRYLASQGFKVEYARNFTDVDDKIINKANDLGQPWLELAEKYIDSFTQDMAALGCLPPTYAPRATNYIAEMLEDIESLIARGHAYELSGDVYFDVKSCQEYGLLSRRKLDDQEAGARVAVDSRKKDASDFALWKSSRPGEPSWPSPWGEGRPGWHTECSAMSYRLLGASFDIHGGGNDLIFPHHENELAQALALGRPMASVWAHNGFVTIDKAKMSKSGGNARNVKDILKIYPPEVARYFLLSHQYRMPINYTEDSLLDSWRALERIYRTLALEFEPLKSDALEPLEVMKGRVRFAEAMDDDLNTAAALGVVFDMAHALNRVAQEGQGQLASHYRQAILDFGQIFALWQDRPETFLELKKPSSSQVEKELVESIIERRVKARNQKDWAEADRLRQELTDLGVILEDKAGQTTWRYA
ncbi:MAG: cysteine--tRNA ligase [Deltaproteobacteria bacterium]|jgi:cysteinyl-tRNA synthetase|nr:cysteine--tRNA ligase [Deltaproteobacteria bacterium]